MPKEFVSDGGSQLISKLFLDFLEKWGVKHVPSSLYCPQSNGRAEAADKIAKKKLLEIM